MVEDDNNNILSTGGALCIHVGPDGSKVVVDAGGAAPLLTIPDVASVARSTLVHDPVVQQAFSSAVGERRRLESFLLRARDETAYLVGPYSVIKFRQPLGLDDIRMFTTFCAGSDPTIWTIIKTAKVTLVASATGILKRARTSSWCPSTILRSALSGARTDPAFLESWTTPALRKLYKMRS